MLIGKMFLRVIGFSRSACRDTLGKINQTMNLKDSSLGSTEHGDTHGLTNKRAKNASNSPRNMSSSHSTTPR